MSGVGPLMGDISWMALKSNGFVLELGVFSGEGSTTAIQDGLKYHSNPLHISVDWDANNLVKHKPTVDWWRFVVGDTRDARTYMAVTGPLEDARAAGLIFIDTDHNYDQMRAELELWQQLADDQTTWLFHDTVMYGVDNVEMVRAITEFADANGWKYEDYRRDSHGLGRMRR